MEKQQLSLKSRTCEKKISYSKLPVIKAFMKEGYRPDKIWCLFRATVGVLALRKRDHVSKLQKVMLLFVNTRTMSILGHVKVRGQNGSDLIQHVDVFGCSLSPNYRALGVVFAVMSDSVQIYDAYKCMVHIYDVPTWQLVQLFKCCYGIAPAIAFNPSFGHSRLTLVGLREDISQLPTIKNYDLKTGRFRNVSNVNYFDMDGESLLHLTFSKDGRFLILQATECIGYAHDFMFMTYILDSSSFKLIRRCSSAMAVTCHPECMPLVYPTFSGNKLKLLNKKPGKHLNTTEYIFPAYLDLKCLCRNSIIQNIDESQIDHLDISHELKEYLRFSPIYL